MMLILIGAVIALSIVIKILDFILPGHAMKDGRNPPPKTPRPPIEPKARPK